MLFNDIIHSMLLQNILMIINDDRTCIRDSFKTTDFVYHCLYPV